jgi:hypothetical protein
LRNYGICKNFKLDTFYKKLFWLAITVLVTLNNPSVKVVVKRYFDMFLRFVVLFVFIIAVGLVTIKFWETEQRRPSEKMVEKLGYL